MKIKIIEKAIELFKSVSDLCKQVLESSDPEKYATSVQKLNEGVSETYDVMRKIIEQSEQFSDEEKIQKLAELSKQEQLSKSNCAELIKGHREHTAQIAKDIFSGLLTCGLSYIPAIAKGIKSLSAHDKIELSAQQQQLIEQSIES